MVALDSQVHGASSLDISNVGVVDTTKDFPIDTLVERVNGSQAAIYGSLSDKTLPAGRQIDETSATVATGNFLLDCSMQAWHAKAAQVEEG